MNRRLRSLLQQKQARDTELDTLQEQAGWNNAKLTPEQSARADAIRAELLELNREIRKETEADGALRSAAARAKPANEAPSYGLEPGSYRGGHRFADMFPDDPRSNDDFKSPAEFLKVVHAGIGDSRLIMAAATGGSEGVGVDGGFVVPAEFVAELMDASLEDEIVRPRASVRPMQSNTLFFPGFNTLDHTSSIGGFDAAWIGEGDPIQIQKGLLMNRTLVARKLALMTAATNELLADSVYFEMELPELLTKAIGWGLDNAFLTGTGVAQPRGVLQDAALIVVAKESGQTADTINWENMKKMFTRLHPASRENAVWVANADTKVQLLSLVQLVKNVAGSENVGGTWIPAIREESGRFYILGIEVLFTEKLPTLGDQGDIVLADFSQYMVGMRKEVTLDKSGHVGFTKDETYFRSILRADGMGRWSAPMKPKNGPNTLSWCVTLAARA